MRLFFLLLLLTNIAFFTWYYQMGAFDEREAPLEMITKSDSGIPTLVLVNERDKTAQAGGQRPRPAAAPESNGRPPAAEPPVVAAVERRCVIAGPYDAQAAADAARRTAAGYGIAARIEETEREVAASSWVVLEGRYSVADARRILGEMRESGLDDLAITPLDDGGNVISLGLYSRQDTLESRLREIVDHGYSAEVQKRVRTVPAYSLRLSLEAGDLTPMARLIDELVKQEPRIEWRDVECR